MINKPRSKRIVIKPVLLFFVVLSLYACATSFEKRDGGPPSVSIDIASVPDAVPRDEPRSKYGNPESYVVMGKRYHVMDSSSGYVEKGIASWYGDKFHGRRTSSGEIYDMYAMTAAHKTLPLPSYVEITNLENSKRIIAKVNDRGPFHANRIIDLSYTAAAKLDIVRTGTGLVEVRVINPRTYMASGTTIPVSAGSGPVSGFYIQVGSFISLANARNLSDRLAGLGDNLHISMARVNGRTVYRVRLGPILDISTADRIIAGLGSYGITEHHITID
jgi:rare lipoprotein A